MLVETRFKELKITCVMIQILTKTNLSVPIQWISMRAANLGFRTRPNRHWDSCRMIWRPSGFQRRRVNGEIDDDGGEGIRRGPSQVAAKEDLHAARAPLCDHFLFFFFFSQGRRTSFRAAHKRWMKWNPRLCWEICSARWISEGRQLRGQLPQ